MNAGLKFRLYALLCLGCVTAAVQAAQTNAQLAATLFQQAKLTASNGAPGDEMGYSIALSGDGNTMAVGVPFATVITTPNQGVVYVFVKPSGGSWATTSTYTAELFYGTTNDSFGASVSISSDGSTIVVGAPGVTFGNNFYQGAAYVFVRPQSGWESIDHYDAILYASDGQGSNFFGSPVAISADGSTVASGASFAKIGSNPQQGAVYLYKRPVKGWIDADTGAFDAKLTAFDGAAYDALGSSVALSTDGSTVLTGAPLVTVGANQYQGAAYVFVKPAGPWATTGAYAAKLTASDGAYPDSFSSAVAISGDGNTVVSATSNLSKGAAYVYVKPGGGWANTSSFTAKLTSSDSRSVDCLGRSVAISNDGSTVAAGAYFVNVGANTFQGAAYIFMKPSTGWVTTNAFNSKLLASDGAAYDELGSSIALSSDGTTVASGAPADSNVPNGANSKRGQAYVFLNTPPILQAPSLSTPTQTGITVNSAILGGTVDSDGNAGISKRGILYAKTATNNNPTLNAAGVIEIDDVFHTTGTFTLNIAGLTPNTSYSFVAFASNGVGNGYTGPVSTFTTAALKPTASAQAVNVKYNTAKDIVLAGSDPNTPPLALTYKVVSNPLNGTLTGTAPALTYTPTAGVSGADSFLFTVTNSANLTSDPAVVSLIVDSGKPTAIITPLSGSFVKPAIVNFDGTQSNPNIVAYKWDFGDGTTDTQAMPVHTYANSGTYTVILIVSSDNGVSSSPVKVDVTVTGAMLEGKFNDRTASLKYTLMVPPKVVIGSTVTFEFGGYYAAFPLRNGRGKVKSASVQVSGSDITFTVKSTAKTFFGDPPPTTGSQFVNVKVHGTLYVETVTFTPSTGSTTTFK